MTYTVGIDIGGTNTVVGLVEASGEIVQRVSLPTATFEDGDTYVEAIVDSINDIVKRQREVLGEEVRIDGIGVGAPNGNCYTGCIENAVNLKFKGKVEICKRLKERLGVPVALGNDADAAAYGEYVYGAAKGIRHFIMFTLGTGVGGGVVVDGHLLHGATGCAGELGHLVQHIGGRECGCGRRGCLEAYASASGIVRTYIELRHERGEKEGVLVEYKDEEITCKMVGDAAKEGDALAVETWRRTAEELAIGMTNAVAFSSPEAIFLIGGPALVGAPLWKPLEEYFNRYLLRIYKGSVRLCRSALKESDAAVLGAAALVKNDDKDE